MIDQDEVILYSMLSAKFMKSSTTKLSAVVRNQYSKKIIAADDGLSNKVLYSYLNDVRKRLDLDPFCEIVDGHQEKLALIRCERERAKNIHTPLNK